MRTRAAFAVAAMLAASACARGVSVKARVETPKLAPVRPDALAQFDKGLRSLRLGGPESNDKAASRFEAAVKIDPTLWEGWYDLGVVYARAGDDSAAFEAYDRALKVNPAHTASLLARAESARRLRMYKEARRDYETALERDPVDATTRLRLASLLREAGELDDDLAAIREALRIKPNDPHAYVELGLHYLAADREELAELVLNKAATMDDKSPLAWNALALVSLRRGDDQQAFERFDHATSLDPEFRDARFNKASVLLDAGDYARALPELEAVTQGHDDDLEAQLALGVAFRGLAEYDRAASTWGRVLKLAPKNPDALWNLAVLEMDFKRNEAGARENLARYLQAAPQEHPRRKEAEARMKELGAGGGK